MHRLAGTDGPLSVQIELPTARYDAALQSLQTAVGAPARSVADGQTSGCEGERFGRWAGVNDSGCGSPVARAVHWLQRKCFLLHIKLEHVLLNGGRMGW